MDKKQLVTIAVTAVISVIATETAKWLFSLVKTTAMTATIKEKARIIFSKNNRRIIGDLFWVGLMLWFLTHAMLEKTPLTRFDVLKIVVFSIGTLFWVAFLMFDLITAKRARERDSQ